MENNVYAVTSLGYILNTESVNEALSAFCSRPETRMWVSVWKGEEMVVPSIEITDMIKATIRESRGRGE